MISFTLKSVIIVALMMIAAVSAKTRTGSATPYDGSLSESETSCSYSSSSLDRKWLSLFVSLNEKDFDRVEDACGKCVRVKGASSTNTRRALDVGALYVKILDKCSGKDCKKGQLSFSSDAMRTIDSYSWDTSRIRWEVVECPTSSNLRGGRN